jgi:Kazal-type serine protease inhibitor domain
LRQDWLVPSLFEKSSVRIVPFALLALAVGCYDRSGDGPGALDAAVEADSGGGGDKDAGPSECYSPTSHLELAYDDDAIGCACRASDDAICIDGVALICTDGRWQAVEDGPCQPEPPAPECEGMIVDSSARCLQDDAFCRELPDGRYCTGPMAPMCPAGSEPIAPDAECPADADCWQYSESLRCTRPSEPAASECEGMIVDSSAGCLQDDAYCRELPDGRYCTGPMAPMCPSGATPIEPDAECPPDANCWQYSESLRCTRPSEPVTSECEGMIVDTAAGCLQDDAFCRELPDGRYCTGPMAPMCPAGATPIAPDAECPADANCWQYSESLRCSRTASYTPEECAAAGGVAIADPGDGSVVAGGCPEGGTSLGMIDAGWDEGGLCCVARVACGARAGATCIAQQYCAYEEGGLCGAADAEANCRARPSACDADLKPVCGCDGKTYSNKCEANAAGTGILSSGECA